MAASSDSEEDAPLHLRRAVQVVGESSRTERDAALLANAIDLTADDDDLPVPPPAADSNSEDAPLRARAPPVPPPPIADSEDEDAPLTARARRGKPARQDEAQNETSDEEDAP
eukprot:1358980-Prymnesium_polylepis.1